MSGLKALLPLAPGLKDAQFKLAAALAMLAEDNPHHSVTIGARALCKAAGISNAAFPAALKRLEELKHIAVRHGTATTKNRYLVTFLSTIRPVSFSETPPVSQTETHPSLFATHPVSTSETAHTESTPLNPTYAASDLDATALRLIDQILSAKRQNHEENLISTFRHWLHGYMSKLGRDENNRPLTNPHPPPDDIVAQFLTIAEPKRLGTLLDSLMLDKQTCHSYAWFVAVALQRIHGIAVTQQRKARATLKLVRNGGRQEDPQWQQQTLEAMASVVQAKKLR